MKHPGGCKGILGLAMILSAAVGAAALAVLVQRRKKNPAARRLKPVRVEGKKEGNAAVTTAYYLYSVDAETQPGGEMG